jgi:TolB protein
VRGVKLSTPFVAAVIAATAAVAVPATATASRRSDLQYTTLISRSYSGKMPNGPSTHPVISNDKRYARAIAFESLASNIVRGDRNGVQDVFAVLRKGPIGNNGSPWKARRTVLISRTRSGAPANGPSSMPAINGGFHRSPTCVGFLSDASNIVGGDTNGVTDAFVKNLYSGAPRRLLPGGHQSPQPATAISVSGSCREIAFVTGGKLYLKRGGGRARMVGVPGTAADPSFSSGLRDDLVFSADRGVYLVKQGSSRARLVAPGGRNPAYNDLKRQVLTYEIWRSGHWQIGYKDVGRRQQIISKRGGSLGNADSRDPVIGNSGYYVTFETDASNLGTNVNKRTVDDNGQPDVYLYTNVRKLTLVQSVAEKGLPLDDGGQHPSMSYYANYIVFDADVPLVGPAGNLLASLLQPASALGTQQVYMRYLGPV